MNIRVGISISEPAEEELVGLGLSELHVRHAFIELVRHLLAAGGSVAYGGDFRAKGYTQALFDLARTYNPQNLTPSERIFNYLAWPIWKGISTEDLADLANVATVTKVSAPEGAPDNLSQIEERTQPELFWNSMALTGMRRVMTSEIGARIVIGGRVSGQQGIYPGIIEEADLALQKSVPLFVIGGFGGCGHLLAKCLHGESPPELTIEYQVEHTARFNELVVEASNHGSAPDYDSLVRRFTSARMSGLRNNLSEAENQILRDANDIDQVLPLIIKGLRLIPAEHQ
jgi:hypothetical protein